MPAPSCARAWSGSASPAASRWCAECDAACSSGWARASASGLKELTLTTNGSQLARYAQRSAACRRQAGECLARHARSGQVPRASPAGASLPKVLAGIDAARAAGLEVKINTVALKGVNEDEIAGLMRWAHGRGFDFTLIETMPLGEIDGRPRRPQYLPLSLVRARPGTRNSRSTTATYRTGGPARYVRVAETGGRLGLHHAAHPQFLRKLQPRAADLHRHALHVPGPGTTAPICARRCAPRRTMRRLHAAIDDGDRAQAQGP